MHILIAAHLQLEWYYLDISESNFGVRAISIYNSLFLWLPFLLYETAVCLRSNDTKDDTRIPMTRSYYWHTAMNAKENIKKLKILCCHIKQIQFAHISCGKTYHRFLHQLNTYIPVDTVLCYVLISIRTISYSFISTIVRIHFVTKFNNYSVEFWYNLHLYEEKWSTLCAI